MRAALIAVPLAAFAIAAFASTGRESGEPAPPSLVDNGTSIGMPGRETLTIAEAEEGRAAKLLPSGAKSLLRVEGQLRHGEYRWDDTGIGPGKLVIWIDLRSQIISAYRNGHEIGTSAVVYGAKDMETPLGRFPILSKQKDYHSRAYDAPMPYSLFITNTGVALHGSKMSARHATHGCVGLPVDFARQLFAAAKTGDEVVIVRSDAAIVEKVARPKS